MKGSADDQRIDFDHENTVLKVPETRIMEYLHSSVELQSQVGSKRKAADDTNARKENATIPTTPAVSTQSQDEEEPATSNSTPVKKVSLSSILGYEDPVGATSSTDGRRMTSPKSWPMAAIDDLNPASSLQGSIMAHGLPKKRQRYQRRNSFLVRRDSSLTASSLSILEDINRACFGELRVDTTIENDKRPKNVLAFLKNASPAAKRTAAGEQHRINAAATTWGHASWSNTEDTNWYSGFSHLSVDSTKPILPPPAQSVKKNSPDGSEQQEQGKEGTTMTTTTRTDMLPPRPYKRYSDCPPKHLPADKLG